MSCKKIDIVHDLLKIAKDNGLKKIALDGICIEFFTEPKKELTDSEVATYEKFKAESTTDSDEQDLFWSSL